MTRNLLALGLLFVASTASAKTDPRLATLSTVTVVAADPLEDDAPVATCFADHLPRALPLTIAEPPTQADAVVRITARVYGETSRKLGAAIGGQSSVSLGSVKTEVLVDGKVIWSDRSVVDEGNKTKRSVDEDRCSLADAGINDLRKAMKKARDGK